MMADWLIAIATIAAAGAAIGSYCVARSVGALETRRESEAREAEIHRLNLSVASIFAAALDRLESEAAWLDDALAKEEGTEAYQTADRVANAYTVAFDTFDLFMEEQTLERGREAEHAAAMFAFVVGVTKVDRKVVSVLRRRRRGP